MPSIAFRCRRVSGSSNGFKFASSAIIIIPGHGRPGSQNNICRIVRNKSDVRIPAVSAEIACFHVERIERSCVTLTPSLVRLDVRALVCPCARPSRAATLLILSSIDLVKIILLMPPLLAIHTSCESDTPRRRGVTCTRRVEFLLHGGEDANIAVTLGDIRVNNVGTP